MIYHITATPPQNLSAYLWAHIVGGVDRPVRVSYNYLTSTRPSMETVAVCAPAKFNSNEMDKQKIVLLYQDILQS